MYIHIPSNHRINGTAGDLEVYMYLQEPNYTSRENARLVSFLFKVDDSTSSSNNKISFLDYITLGQKARTSRLAGY